MFLIHRLQMKTQKVWWRGHLLNYINLSFVLSCTSSKPTKKFSVVTAPTDLRLYLTCSMYPPFDKCTKVLKLLKLLHVTCNSTAFDQTGAAHCLDLKECFLKQFSNSRNGKKSLNNESKL